MAPGAETINKYVGDFIKQNVDNYLHIHKEDCADILETKIKESERERKAMAGVTKLARERSKKANLHNRKLRDCRIHFCDAKTTVKKIAASLSPRATRPAEASPRVVMSIRRLYSRYAENPSTLLD